MLTELYNKICCNHTHNKAIFECVGLSNKNVK